ncbi:hypothetical protein V5O48_004400 [Marasmius crinis-equi]|uniref:Zn(2)-C6 fungal-type domain-containing protein n=1 Tax=Marasmius crinis-equi TaxID=585013 RepID=A0ABR3FQ52_9AGAR
MSAASTSSTKLIPVAPLDTYQCREDGSIHTWGSVLQLAQEVDNIASAIKTVRSGELYKRAILWRNRPDRPLCQACVKKSIPCVMPESDDTALRQCSACTKARRKCTVFPDYGIDQVAAQKGWSRTKVAELYQVGQELSKDDTKRKRNDDEYDESAGDLGCSSASASTKKQKLSPVKEKGKEKQREEEAPSASSSRTRLSSAPVACESLPDPDLNSDLGIKHERAAANITCPLSQSALQQEVADLKSKLLDTSRERNRLKEDHVTACENLEVVRARVEDLETQLTAKTSEMEGLQENHTAICGALISTHDEAESRAQSLENELTVRAKEANDYKDDCKTLQSERTRAETRIKDLDALLKTKTTEIERLKEVFESNRTQLQSRVSSLQSQVNAKANEINLLKQHRTNSAAAERSRTTEFERNLATKSSELDRLKRTHDTTCNTLRGELEQAKLRTNELEAALNDVNGALSKMETSRDSKQYVFSSFTIRSLIQSNLFAGRANLTNLLQDTVRLLRIQAPQFLAPIRTFLLQTGASDEDLIWQLKQNLGPMEECCQSILGHNESRELVERVEKLLGQSVKLGLAEYYAGNRNNFTNVVRKLEKASGPSRCDQFDSSSSFQRRLTAFLDDYECLQDGTMHSRESIKELCHEVDAAAASSKSARSGDLHTHARNWRNKPDRPPCEACACSQGSLTCVLQESEDLRSCTACHKQRSKCSVFTDFGIDHIAKQKGWEREKVAELYCVGRKFSPEQIKRKDCEEDLKGEKVPISTKKQKLDHGNSGTGSEHRTTRSNAAESISNAPRNLARPSGSSAMRVVAAAAPRVEDKDAYISKLEKQLTAQKDENALLKVEREQHATNIRKLTSEKDETYAQAPSLHLLKYILIHLFQRPSPRNRAYESQYLIIAPGNPISEVSEKLEAERSNSRRADKEKAEAEKRAGEVMATLKQQMNDKSTALSDLSSAATRLWQIQAVPFLGTIHTALKGIFIPIKDSNADDKTVEELRQAIEFLDVALEKCCRPVISEQEMVRLLELLKKSVGKPNEEIKHSLETCLAKNPEKFGRCIENAVKSVFAK